MLQIASIKLLLNDIVFIVQLVVDEQNWAIWV